MITQKKAANAIGGKTARVCESCLTKRARWFCPADDAFLCQICDSLVHSANELAGRHKRVRLGTASFKPVQEVNTDDCIHSHKSATIGTPAWHQGFTKKARTPRYGAKRAKSAQENNSLSNTQMMSIVPEMSGDEGSFEEENEEHMIFSVPTFEPFEVELENPINNEVNSVGLELEDDEFNISLIGFEDEGLGDWNNLPGFLPSDNKLTEFAADVENLLLEQSGIGEDPMYTILSLTDRENVSERPFSIKNIESVLEKETHEEIKVEEDEEDRDPTIFGGCLEGKLEVKVEEETENTTNSGHFDWSMDAASKILNFKVNNYGKSQVRGVEDAEEKKVEVMTMREIEDKESHMQAKKRRKIFLRLNYEEVINAWPGSSPWTTGCRPEFDPEHDCWPDNMGVVGHLGAHHPGKEVMREKGNVDGGDGDREARVSRYKEKRRTRLFSKKIRYEVRKLNAEKRPRLKGRFVKRTALAPGY